MLNSNSSAGTAADSSTQPIAHSSADIEANPLLAEVPTVEGSIRISHDVECPHCNETMYDDLDRDWWNENLTDQLPNEDEYKSKFKINCKECGKPFIIDGFVY